MYPVSRVFFQGGRVNGRSRLPQGFLHTAAIQKHILLPGVTMVIAKHLLNVITLQFFKKYIAKLQDGTPIMAKDEEVSNAALTRLSQT